MTGLPGAVWPKPVITTSFVVPSTVLSGLGGLADALAGLGGSVAGLGGSTVGLLDSFLAVQHKYPNPEVPDHPEQYQHFDQEPLRFSPVQWPDYH